MTLYFFSHGDAATEAPDTDEPPFGWCPECDYALVDEHECRCGWNEYEAVGAASPRAVEGSDSGSKGSHAAGSSAAPASNLASPVYRRRGGEG